MIKFSDLVSIYHQFSDSLMDLNFSHYFLFFLILVVLIACYQIIKPYLHTIILAIILAAILNPIYHRILKLVRGRENMAALLSCMFLTLVVVLPLLLISFALIRQGIQSINAMHDWIVNGSYVTLLEHPIVVKTYPGAIKFEMLKVINRYTDKPVEDVYFDSLIFQ